MVNPPEPQKSAPQAFEGPAGRVLDTALKSGATYADVRFERGRSERIEVRNGVVVTLADDRSAGFGVRALSTARGGSRLQTT